MKPMPHGKTGIVQFKGYSLRATWQAISTLQTTHFPLILPGAHPLASFFILRKLKKLGFSSCMVTASDNGLVVHAHR